MRNAATQTLGKFSSVDGLLNANIDKAVDEFGNTLANEVKGEIKNQVDNAIQSVANTVQKKFINKIGDTLFGAITTRAKQIDNLLDDLNYGYFNAAISQVQNVYNENKNKTFSAYPPEAKVSVFYAFQLVETLKIIINTSMLNEDLTLNIDIEGPLEIGQQVYDLLPPSHNIDSKKNALHVEGKGTDGSISAEKAEDLVQQGRDCDYDDEAAIDYWKRAAKASNSEAMFLLGSAYQNGYNGVYEDDYEAFKWYKRSAVRGDDWFNARSMFELGMYYSNFPHRKY